MNDQVEMAKWAEFWYEEGERKVPRKWEICEHCRGHGHHGHEAFDGIPYVVDEDHDYEFWDDLRQGVYDVTCDECRGTGKILTIDESELTKQEVESLNEWLSGTAETEAIYRMERMMGA